MRWERSGLVERSGCEGGACAWKWKWKVHFFGCLMVGWLVVCGLFLRGGLGLGF